MLHKRYVHTIVLSNDLQLCIWHPLQWLRPDDGFVFTNSVLHTYLISEYVECGGTGEYTEEVGSDTKRENRQEKKEQTVREETKTQNTLKKNRKLDAKSFEKQRRRWRLQAASISNACCHNWILLCIFFSLLLLLFCSDSRFGRLHPPVDHPAVHYFCLSFSLSVSRYFSVSWMNVVGSFLFRAHFSLDQFLCVCAVPALTAASAVWLCLSYKGTIKWRDHSGRTERHQNLTRIHGLASLAWYAVARQRVILW